MRYLDHAATTPVLEEVREAMLPYLTDLFGNPSSVYTTGRDAKKGIEEARENVAEAIGALPNEIVFTAGGTEADNAALKGVAFKSKERGAHILTTEIEHHAILHSAQWLARKGFRVSFVGVESNGVVDPERVAESLYPDTALVSVMLANNEIGAIQPVREIADAVHKNSRALVHTDAVQGLGKIPLDVDQLGVDLASFSAHKLGGPKGVGAMFVRRKTQLEPFIHGGGQERDLRSGTPNVAGIVGFGVAAKIAAKEVEQESERLGILRDRLQDQLLTSIDGIRLNSADAPRVAGTLSVCIEKVEGESLLLLLDAEGIAVSSGSACTSGSLDPSHVLMAIGIPKELAIGSLRISMGRSTTPEDTDAIAEALPRIVARLRNSAGGRR